MRQGAYHAPKKRMSSPGHSALPSVVRIPRKGFLAEIFVSSTTLLAGGKIFHYVIQREGLPEVVHWGQETSLKDAMKSVEDFFAQNDRRREA